MSVTNTDPYNGFTQFSNVLSGNPYLLTGNPYVLSLGLSPLEIRRVNDEILFWRFYKAEHWTYKRPDGEPQNTVNYARKFIDKQVAFLTGKGFTLNPKREAVHVIKPVLDFVWDDNKRDLLAVELAQAASVTGNAFLKVAVEVYDPEDEPMMAELYPNGRIRLMLLPGYTVFPRFDGHDRTKMVSCFIIYPIWIVENGMQKAIWYREVITKDTIQEYLNDELISERPNELREIPVVMFRNMPVAGESYGYSDMKDIVPLQQEYNEKTTDVSDIINYHAAPVTVVYGAKANNLERGAKKIWGGLPKDAKIENLELKSDLKASMEYIDRIKTSMFEISAIPEDALGSDQAQISNTSGIALHMKNQSLIDVTKLKQATFREGILQACRLILRYAEIIELDIFDVEAFKALKPIEKYVYDVEFPDPLPKDELIEMQLVAQKISANLMTHVQALEELGDPNPEETWNFIKQEMLELADMQYHQAVNANGGVDPNTDPNGGGGGGKPTSGKTKNPNDPLANGNNGSFDRMLQGAKKALGINVGGVVHKSEKADPLNKAGNQEA
jgi:hypothetical protein